MLPKRKKLPSETDLCGILRKVGLKATASRLAILAVIRRSRIPLSVQDIMERLGKRFDQATVYRFIKKLSRIGVIRQIDLRQNHARFEFSELDDHHHLMCTHCGRIENIMGCDIEKIYKTILYAINSFSEIRQHSLEFYGICVKCAKKERSQEMPLS